MKHIEIETLIKKFEGQIADNEREIAVHIAACSQCAAESAKLADFFLYAEQHTSDKVPQAATARILNIYQQKSVPAQPERSITKMVASLLFDDWEMAVNERFSGLDTRQLLYRIGDFEVDLRLELVGDNCHLSGQIFPERQGTEVEIVSSTNTSSEAISEFGEFTFDIVPQGEYDVRISINDEVLTIEKAPFHR